MVIASLEKQEVSESSHQASGEGSLQGSGWGGVSDALLSTDQGISKSSSRNESGALNVLSTEQGLTSDLHE